MRVYRFWDSDNEGHRYGPWFTDSDDVNRLIDEGASPADVRDRYALPADGQDRMSILDVEPETTMRAGITGPWPEHGLKGGGPQYAIREPSLKKNTDRMVEDDFPGRFPDDEDGIPLDDVLNGEIELTAF